MTRLAHTVLAAALAAHPVTLHDARIDEASGLAIGLRSPGVYYVQNDSGDTARFFAVDRADGRTRAVYRVPGAVNHDWEDLAVAPDRHGTPSVWLADIGDNAATRSEIDLYRVDEPRVDMTAYGRTASTARPDEWRLRYRSGPANAESLAVTPTGTAYVITKVDSGRSAVYRVPPDPDRSRVQTLRRIGSIDLPSHGGLIPANLQRLATGASISPDGRLLVVRTYTDAYVWTVRHDDVAAALRRPPAHVTLPLQQQGEGVCFDGRSLVLDSEGRHTPIVRVALPAGLAAPSTSSSASSPSTANPPVSAPGTTTPAARAPGTASHSRAPLVTALAALAAAVVLAALGLAAVRARGRRE